MKINDITKEMKMALDELVALRYIYGHYGWSSKTDEIINSIRSKLEYKNEPDPIENS